MSDGPWRVFLGETVAFVMGESAASVVIVVATVAAAAVVIAASTINMELYFLLYKFIKETF